MNRRGIMWAGILIGALALGGCQSAVPEETVVFSTAAETEAETAAAETEPAEEPEPIQKAEGPEDFADLSVSLAAPEGAENAEYYRIDGTVAEVNFIRDGIRYSFRGAPGEEDPSGVYEALSEEALSASGVDLTAEIRTTAGGGRLASWTDGAARYSLYAAAPVEDEAILSLTEELIRITEAGGAIGRRQVENLEGLSALGVPLGEPEGAEDLTCYILGETTAELRFVYEDASFLFRGAAGSVESGEEEDWQEEAEPILLEYEGGDLELTVRQAENGAREAAWQSGDFAYCLYTAGPVEEEDWQEICAEAADTTRME